MRSRKHSGNLIGCNHMQTDLRFALRSVLGRSPAVYFGIQRLWPSRRHLLVTKDTEIVIEGYPRSANTFAVAAFLLAQGRPVRIAHHLHVPVQIIQAVRWGIPTVVLIRKPEDAILSSLVRRPYLSAEWAARYYILFYRTIAPYREGFVVAPFEEVIHNFGQVILRINKRFGTTFVPFEHTDENVQRVFALVEEMDKADRKSNAATETTVARHSATRQALKEARKQELDQLSVRRLLDEAYGVYIEMVNPQSKRC